MRSFLDGLMSMLRDPARVFVLLMLLSACGGAERKFADNGKDGGGAGGATGSDGSVSGTGGQRDGSADGTVGSGGGGMSDARIDSPTDAGMVEDTGPPPPPPPPGKPG